MDNRYENVNVGNEMIPTIAAINNYSQQDFEILQQIYNHAKKRTFSSIPRIEGDNDKYYYEILRLDDPLAMAIGKLTNCCQRLNEPGRQCMEHSMVDKNGRLFVIRNRNNPDIIIAQSWVWRNKDVLCFDNIEVPNQQMWDHGIPKGLEDAGIRNEFTDEILSIYQQAAKKIVVEDEKKYKDLLELGKISQEQYEGLRIGKVTTGLGYSNIKGSFVLLTKDKEIARPLPFTPPVDIGGRYYTDDSSTQYILEEREDRKAYDGETLQVYNDSFIEYNDSNFNEKSLLSLEKLEIVTKDDLRYLETFVEDYADREHLVTEIAKNYGLNPETTKIVMNPNFAVIYSIDGNRLKVGDLLFNLKVDNEMQQMDIEEQVVMQIRLAFEQISQGKEIDISSLDDKQKEIYAKAASLTDEIDMGRGVGHAR